MYGAKIQEFVWELKVELKQNEASTPASSTRLTKKEGIARRSTTSRRQREMSTKAKEKLLCLFLLLLLQLLLPLLSLCSFCSSCCNLLLAFPVSCRTRQILAAFRLVSASSEESKEEVVLCEAGNSSASSCKG